MTSAVAAVQPAWRARPLTGPPRAGASSSRKTFTNAAANSMTVRKSSTDTAEPSPSAVRPIICRYARKETVSVRCAPAVITNTVSKMR